MLIKKIILFISLMLISLTISAKTIDILESKARSGDADSMYKLGLIYENGFNPKRGEFISSDINMSIYWYERADKLGIVRASTRLGVIYFNDGEYIKSSEFLKKGIEKKEPLAFLYYSKILKIQKKLEEANKHLEYAVIKGVPEALYIFGKNKLDESNPNYYQAYIYIKLSQIKGYNVSNDEIRSISENLSSKQLYVANIQIKKLDEKLIENKK